jgi:hypothetical protein
MKEFCKVLPNERFLTLLSCPKNEIDLKLGNKVCQMSPINILYCVKSLLAQLK